MLYFMARLGRKPWFKYFAPSVTMLASYGYIAIKLTGPSLFKDMLRSQDQYGDLVEVEPELKKLIDEVEPRAKSEMKCWEEGNGIFWKQLEPKRSEWFVSSSRDPIVLGFPFRNFMTSFGLPLNINYSSREDMPEPKLIDPLKQSGEDFKKELFKQELSESYKDAFLISEDAKRFAIAKAVFQSEPDYAISFGLNVMMAILIPLLMSRYFIIKGKLQHVSLSKRIPFYLTSSIFGFMQYTIVGDCLQSLYDKKTDESAIKLGFKQGAIDYYSKYIEQNKVLKAMLGDRADVDEDGNNIRGFLPSAARSVNQKLEEVKNA